MAKRRLPRKPPKKPAALPTAPKTTGALPKPKLPSDSKSPPTSDPPGPPLFSPYTGGEVADTTQADGSSDQEVTDKTGPPFDTEPPADPPRPVFQQVGSAEPSPPRREQTPRESSGPVEHIFNPRIEDADMFGSAGSPPTEPAGEAFRDDREDDGDTDGLQRDLIAGITAATAAIVMLQTSVDSLRSAVNDAQEQV